MVVSLNSRLEIDKEREEESTCSEEDVRACEPEEHHPPPLLRKLDHRRGGRVEGSTIFMLYCRA